MPTTGGLRFSRKASAAMLHRITIGKYINFRTPMPNAVRCQYAGGDVDANSPFKNVKLCR